MPCSSTRCPGCPQYVPFPPYGWSAPDGLPLLLRKQPIWAAGDTPHRVALAPGSDGAGWPSHPLYCRCLPCAHSAIRSILVPCSRCSGCLSCLAVPLLLVCCARPCPSWCGSLVLCVCVAPPPFCWRSWVPLSRTPSCPTRLPPCTRVSHLRTTWTVPCAVGWSRPCCHPRGGHLPARGAQLPPLWSTWAPWRGTGGGGFVDGSLGVRHICRFLQCSHLMVPLCIVVCLFGACLTAVCGVALCLVALLLAFLPTSGSFFLLACSLLLVCSAGGAACRTLHPLVAVGLSHLQLGGTRGTRHCCTCLHIYKLMCH